MGRGGVSFGHEKMAILLEIQDHKCAYCFRDIVKGTKQKDPRHATLDHVWPRSHSIRGSDEIGNLLAVCSFCNSSKGGRNPTDAELYVLSKVSPRAESAWNEYLRARRLRRILGPGAHHT